MSFQLTIKTAEELQAEAEDALRRRIADAVEAHIEAQAHALDYKNGAQLCGYANSTVDAWRNQARAYIAWRDLVWQRVFDLAQTADPADTVTPEQVIAALPPWPGLPD